ncbi:MAG: zinc-ribbon domain-containing protein [Eggerthellaceae bacterium]
MTRFCANCGSPLQEGYSFCENCGAPAEQTPVQDQNQAVPAPAEMEAPAAAAQPAQSEPAIDAAAPQVDDAAPRSFADQSFGAPEAGAQPVGAYVPTGEGVQNPAPTGPIFNTGGAKKASGLAIASMVLGILSIVSSGIVVGLIFGIVAIVLFAVARKKHGKSGIGLAGLITGIVGTVLSIVWALLIGGIIVGAVAAEESGALTYDDDGIHYSIGDVDQYETIPVGVWYASECRLTYDGKDYEDGVFSLDEAKDIERDFYDVVLTIEEDGTFSFDYGDESKSGTWSADADCVTLTMDGTGEKLFLFPYDDDKSISPTSGREFDEMGFIDAGLYMELER